MCREATGKATIYPKLQGSILKGIVRVRNVPNETPGHWDTIYNP